MWEAEIEHFFAEGWARLGVLIEPSMLDALRDEADAIMLGRAPHEGLFFQHDAPNGRYEDLTLGEGWIGPSPSYRKIEKLEKDPVFRAWIDHPALAPIAHAIVKEDVVVYRAVLWTKSREGGTELPWHQDGGTFWGVDRDPILQIWTALDEAPKDAGCVELVPGSHRAGLATPLGGVVPDDIIERGRAEARSIHVEAKAGESILIHNHVWHRSGLNRTGHPRRALSVCYMSASTRCLRKKRAPRVFFPVFRR